MGKCMGIISYLCNKAHSAAMKKIHILILKAYIGPLVMTFFIAIFILLMQFLWKYVDDLVGKGLEWYIIAKLLVYASSTFVPLALPLAILLSSLMTFGNLGEHYELVAIKAAGISLKKVMAPLVVLSILISGVAFYFSNNILPYANLKFHSILYDVREQKLALNIKEGMFYDGIDGYVIRVGKKDSDGKTIRNIKIYNHTARMGNINVTSAEWGTMQLTDNKKNLVFNLYNGVNYQEKTDQQNYARRRPFQRTIFKENQQVFDLSAFAMSRTNEDLFRSHYQMLNLEQLYKAEDSLTGKIRERRSEMKDQVWRSYFHLNRNDSLVTVKADTLEKLQPVFIESFTHGDQVRIVEGAMNNTRNTKENIGFFKTEIDQRSEKLYRYEIEVQRKFTLSLACLILFFIGAPLGAIIRKGGFGLPVVFSVLFFVVFHILNITGEKFCREGVLPAWQGMWISSLIFLPIGVFLTIKATSDSPLVDADAWKKGFLRFFPKKTQKKNDANSLSV